MQDVMFATLARILESSQAAGLHGLHHPETADPIQGSLNRHRAISPEVRDDALAAARLEVM